MNQVRGTETLTPGHAEGSEIRFKHVRPEEAETRNRGIRGHAHEAARTEEQGEGRQEEEKQGDGTRPAGAGADSGEIIGGPVCGTEEQVLVLPGLGFVAAAVDGVVVVVGRRFVSVRGGASQREDPLQHCGCENQEVRNVVGECANVEDDMLLSVSHLKYFKKDLHPSFLI